jgi:flavoprotein
MTQYCELREKAHENIVQEYDLWKKALQISWEEYLNEVIKNSNTGTWTKEVAKSLLYGTK